MSDLWSVIKRVKCTCLGFVKVVVYQQHFLYSTDLCLIYGFYGGAL